MVQRSLSTNLSKNTALFHALLPLDDSFDLITRDLKLGNTPAYWIGVNGFCKTEILQQIFSDLQDPLYTLDSEIRDLPRYVQSKLGYAQVSLTSSIDTNSAKYSQWPLCPSGRRVCTGRDHRCPYLSCPQHFRT